MKKANGTRTPKQNVKVAPLSKTNTVGFIDNAFTIKPQFEQSNGGQDQHTAAAPNQPPDEDDLMGGSGSGTKSEVMDKNLLQMFDVLRHRLSVLKEAATTRSALSNEDTNKNSDRMSEQAPKIIDEFDEVVPRSLRDSKMPNLAHKDNLVASDTVYIDPFHLTFSKTKVQTEAAKNLEGMLEESFGNINMRETKNKKSKTTTQTEKSKKSEQLKNEAKRLNRMKLERKLTQNMDQFLTRSVMDVELRFEAPILVDAAPDWPVTIKWCAKDPRSKAAENVEGEFDPDLLLRYSIERINLPSGKRLFSFLVRQPVIQRYFVYLFWLLKVKFFESDAPEDSEAYLLRLLSAEYRRIVEMLAERAHAEHEKDFAFKYLPFILSNGVYFGFYYVFPGTHSACLRCACSKLVCRYTSPSRRDALFTCPWLLCRLPAHLHEGLQEDHLHADHPSHARHTDVCLLREGTAYQSQFNCRHPPFSHRYLFALGGAKTGGVGQAVPRGHARGRRRGGGGRRELSRADRA
jgi:hypothetical protein